MTSGARFSECPFFLSTDQSLYQVDNQKQNYRAQCGSDNRADYASAQSLTRALVLGIAERR